MSPDTHCELQPVPSDLRFCPLTACTCCTCNCPMITKQIQQNVLFGPLSCTERFKSPNLSLLTKLYQIHDMPQAEYLKRSILDLKIGTYDMVEVAYEETPIIEALHKFVNKRVSALPIVDKEVRRTTDRKRQTIKDTDSILCRRVGWSTSTPSLM